MKTYLLAYEYSRNGTSWTTTSSHFKAESEMGAIAQLQSKYPYVRKIRVMSVR